MRMTLNVDEDVLYAVRERARREKRTAGSVLSELARQGLTEHHYSRTAPPVTHHGFTPLPIRGAAVSNELIDRLREEESD